MLGAQPIGDAVKCVLVVDDEPAIRTVIGQVLREAGYAVVLAANGADALEQMREQPPDGVLLDLHMPILDGAAFLRARRDVADFADIPVALITSDRNPRLVGDGLGVKACLPKPFELDELLDAVDGLLGAHADRAASVDGAVAGHADDAAIVALSEEPLGWVGNPPVCHVALSTRAEVAAFTRHISAMVSELNQTRGVSAAAADCLSRARARLKVSRQLLG